MRDRVHPLVALVTTLSNAVGELSSLLYPPLASGAYTLFANPEGRYASPVCATPGGQIHAAGAALAVFPTGVVT
jgi:hypothetical protein